MTTTYIKTAEMDRDYRESLERKMHEMEMEHESIIRAEIEQAAIRAQEELEREAKRDSYAYSLLQDIARYDYDAAEPIEEDEDYCQRTKGGAYDD